MSSIICEKRVYKENNEIHTHPYGQLILPLKGKINIETSDKKLSIGNENLFFLPPDCRHLFNAERFNEFLVLDVPPVFLNRADMDVVEGGKEVAFNEKWEALRYLFLSEAEKESSSAAINNLFMYSYNMLVSESDTASIKYIHEHYNDELDIKELARLEHYNVNYYSEWFKQKMGMTPMEYIQGIRIKKSRELLVNTELTILQIAVLVGYKHNSSFTRAFKEIEGVTPKEYRVISKIKLKNS